MKATSSTSSTTTSSSWVEIEVSGEPRCGVFPRPSDLPDAKAPLSVAEAALHIDRQSADTLLTGAPSRAEYWQSLCPELHVEHSEYCGRVREQGTLALDAASLARLRARIDRDGYFSLDSETLALARAHVNVAALAAGIIQLQRFGWPASFIALYDEAWALTHWVSSVMRATTGNELNMDILAWCIDPNTPGASGFSPHRDRQPDELAASFRGDGSAKYTTCWVALTDASPDNSCLYVLPRWADPGYTSGDLDTIDPLQRALPNKEDFQSIRALPAPAGSCYIFTHRIIHWGSSGRQGYHTPRIALSFACSVEDFEPAYFDRSHLPFPSMALRLALACSQMLVYHERFSFAPKQLSMFHQVFRAQCHLLHDSFRTKVVKEFVAAVKEASMPNLTGATSKPTLPTSATRADQLSASSNDNGEEDESDADYNDDEALDEDDEVVDEALDAMLDAVHAGCDEFDDDFEDDEDEQGLYGDMVAAESTDDDDEDDEEDEEQARKWMEQLNSQSAKTKRPAPSDGANGDSPDPKRPRTR